MDAEDFHRSRRRGRGAGEWTAKGAKEDPPEELSDNELRSRHRDLPEDLSDNELRRRHRDPSEDLSDSELRRRRSYAPSEEFIEVDPVTGKDKPGSQGRAEGRRRKTADDAGGGRGCGSGRNGSQGDAATRPLETTPQGAEGTCAGCGRCRCCGRMASPNDKGDCRYLEEGGAAGGSGGRGGGKGGRRGRGGGGRRTSESSKERDYRSSPDRRRNVYSNNHDRWRDRGRGGGHERDLVRDRGHALAATGHRSDPSGGTGDRGAPRRRQHPPQEQENRSERDYHRHHRTDLFGGSPRSGGRRDLHGPGVEAGYSSGEVSSFGDEDASPRRRRARRETAAAAATAAAAVATQTSARESSLVALRKSGGAVRHRARDDRDGDAALLTPLSTPQRQPAAASARQRHSTWRDGRRAGRGRRVESPESVVSGCRDSGLHGYPSLPPAALSGGRRGRPGDLLAAGGGGGRERHSDGEAGRRRARRRAREVRQE